VIVTHGYEAVMVRWLAEHGLQASAFQTEYGDEQESAAEVAEVAEVATEPGDRR